MTSIRRSRLTKIRVLIATERSCRPKEESPKNKEEKEGKCPFCPGNEKITPPPEILRWPQEGPWDLRCFPNKYGVFKIEAETVYEENEDEEQETENVRGAHEIIVETPEHGDNILTISQKRLENMLGAYKDRIIDLSKDPNIKYIQIFANSGAEAGATLKHPHSQIIATSYTPTLVKTELDRAEGYYEEHNKSIFDWMVEKDKKEGRIIKESDNFIIGVPYAARVPFELFLVPKENAPYFEHSHEHIGELAWLLKDSFLRLEKILCSLPAYNLILHTAPPKHARESYPFFKWHIEITPRTTRLGGFEFGCFEFINPELPEKVADSLRSIII